MKEVSIIIYIYINYKVTMNFNTQETCPGAPVKKDRKRPVDVPNSDVSRILFRTNCGGSGGGCGNGCKILDFGSDYCGGSGGDCGNGCRRIK